MIDPNGCFEKTNDEINLISALDFIDDYSETPFLFPEQTTNNEDREKYCIIMEKGEGAYEELCKLMGLLAQKYDLIGSLSSSWIHNSSRKTSKRLSVSLYNETIREDSPFYISIVVEKYGNGKTRFRVSIDIEDDAEADEIKKYHSFLDIPYDEDDGLVFLTGSDRWGAPVIISQSLEDIRKRVYEGEFRKVQIGVVIDRTVEESNETIKDVIDDAVSKLMPYYVHILVNGSTGTGRGWLLSWNPTKWEWDDYDTICENSRKGVFTNETWSCWSKQPAVGDEVFLIRLGEKPRGIIAHGVVTIPPHEEGHYNTELAENGKKERCVGVCYDRVLNYSKEPILLQDDLVSLFHDQCWSPQNSGIEIKDCFMEVKHKWEQLINDLDEDGKMVRKNEYDKNLILYGPPGTGKTYSAAIYAVAICDDKSLDELTDYDEVMKRYNTLKDQGRITFTTFHQSYGYEEFIEGIKPIVDSESSDVSYTIEAGVFKKFCETAKVVQEDVIEYTGTVWVVRNRAGDKDVSADFGKSLYEDGVIKIEDINDYKRQCDFFNEMAPGDWVVLGRERTINAIGVIVDDTPEEIDDGIFHYQRHVEWKATGLTVDCRAINRGKFFSNFALARSWMKVQDLQKLISEDTKNDKPYVFIIDEINRGNISKIFGELITLIENTKREGMPEAASAILPYSNEPFTVPSNVYIIGTMNTADRSIALMDTALRRRFRFVEMAPDAKVLYRIGADRIVVDGIELNVVKMLETINERIGVLYDREHTIGHAFFTGLASSPCIESLAEIFEKSIIPLLQEYFYEDYQKIQLVLALSA